MKLFVFVFGVAVAASVVAASPDAEDAVIYIPGTYNESICEFGDDSFHDLVLVGRPCYLEGHDKIDSCSENAPSSDYISQCCMSPEDGDVCKAVFAATCMPNIAPELCGHCFHVLAPEPPVEQPCCQGCCAKKSALKESLPGAVYEAIESEWLTQSIDSVEEYNIGDSVGACGCPTEREMKFKGSTTSFTCQPLCCDCCEDMDLSMLTSEAVVTNQDSYTVQTAGGCTPYDHTVSDHVTYYQSTVQNWKGSNTEICYIGNDTDVETVVVIAGGLQAVASYDNEIFTYYYGSTVFGAVSINSKCIRKIDGGNSGRDNSWYPTNNTCDQPDPASDEIPN